MKKNMGGADRVIRIILTLAIGLFYWLGMITGIAATILGVVSIIFVLTSFVGFCPLYAAVGLRTCPKED